MINTCYLLIRSLLLIRHIIDGYPVIIFYCFVLCHTLSTKIYKYLYALCLCGYTMTNTYFQNSIFFLRIFSRGPYIFKVYVVPNIFSLQ